MIVTQVKIRDVRCHQQFQQNFGRGVVLFLGPNGSGKTSVLSAIAWALFDYNPWKLAELKRRGAKSMRVQVWFEHAGQAWRVDRSSRDFKVFKGDELVAQGKANSIWKVVEALQLPAGTSLSTLYRDALGGEQASLTAGFGLSPKGRVDYWGRILGLDRYRRAFEALRPTMRILDQDVKSKLAVGITLVETLGEEADYDPGICIQLATAGLISVDDAKGAAIRKRDALRIEADELQRTIGEAQQAQRHLRQVGEQLITLENMVEAARQRARSILDVGVLREYKQELEAGIDESLVVRCNQARSAVAGLDAEWQSAKRDAANCGIDCLACEENVRRKKALKLSVFRWDRDLSRLDKGLDGVGAEMNRIRVAVAGLIPIPVGGTCPVCGQSVKEEVARGHNKDCQSHLVLFQNRSALLIEQKARLKKEREEVWKDTQALGLQIARLPDEVDKARFHEQWETSIELARSQESLLGNVQRVLVSLEREVAEQAARQAELVELQIKIAVADEYDPGALSRASKALENAKTERDALLGFIGTAPSPQDLAVAKGKIEELDRYLQELARQAVEIRESIVEAQQKQRLIAKIAETETELERAKQIHLLAKSLRGAIDKAGPSIAEVYVRRIAQVANKYWQTLGKGESLSWSGDYLLSLGGRPYGMLSGGEKVGAAFAIRMAIIRDRDIGWVCLDEPTGQLDEDTRVMMAHVLDMFPLEQMFVVSHDRTFASTADQVVRFGEELW